jgi:hypothetical protein
MTTEAGVAITPGIFYSLTGFGATGYLSLTKVGGYQSETTPAEVGAHHVRCAPGQLADLRT